MCLTQHTEILLHIEIKKYNNYTYTFKWAAGKENYSLLLLVMCTKVSLNSYIKTPPLVVGMVPQKYKKEVKETSS